ncbi:MAG: DUF5011 domain-containing protein [Clostridia bacterium]|nr:DUF5011 domain-containing protein [Clostridia bacterium]
MTKNVKKLVLFTVLAIFIIALCACSKTPADDIAPVISGLDTVFMDRESESLDLYAGVSASDVDGAGIETDVTAGLVVDLPSGANREGNKITFNNCGDYELAYTVKDAAGNETVQKRLVQVRNIYNVYCVNATLPVLYCALDMVSNNYKSILTFTRKDTINMDALDDDRFIYAENGAEDINLSFAKGMAVGIAKDDQYSYFRLFLNDAFNQIELFTFIQHNISSDRYEVKLVSDGSWTYNTAFPYREDGAWSKWEANRTLYDGVMAKALAGEFEREDNGRFYVEYEGTRVGSHYYSDSQLSQMAIMAAQRDNTQLWCAYPETLRSDDARVQAEIDKAHMPKMAPDEMYRNLTEEQKSKFLEIVDFDKTEFDANYFDKEGKYLIITGTNPFTGSFTDAEFADILSRIGDNYSDYNLLYKPHPSAATPAEGSLTAKWLADNGVKILPGKLPMEVISWVYSDVAMGGFDSSLFMSVPQGNTKFFIARDASSLSVLTKQLYDGGVFGTPEFYWKAQ